MNPRQYLLPLAIYFFLPFYLILIFNIYLMLVALGLCCCVRAFSGYSGEWGLLFVVVRGPLTAAAFLVEHRFQVHRLQ